MMKTTLAAAFTSIPTPLSRPS